MARANLNKSKKVLTSATTASKYIPKKPGICINRNPPFQTQVYLVKLSQNVSIVKQDLLNKQKLPFSDQLSTLICLRNLRTAPYFYSVDLGLKGGISIDADSGLLGYVL